MYLRCMQDPGAKLLQGGPNILDTKLHVTREEARSSAYPIVWLQHRGQPVARVPPYRAGLISRASRRVNVSWRKMNLAWTGTVGSAGAGVSRRRLSIEPSERYLECRGTKFLVCLSSRESISPPDIQQRSGRAPATSVTQPDWPGDPA